MFHFIGKLTNWGHRLLLLRFIERVCVCVSVNNGVSMFVCVCVYVCVCMHMTINRHVISILDSLGTVSFKYLLIISCVIHLA